MRVCQEYRALNALMKTDSGGLGDVRALIDRLLGSNYFSALDLASGFFQIAIAEEDKHKTAFRDAAGKLWVYNRYVFGLKTLPAAFARFVATVLAPLKLDGVENWLDENSVGSESFEEHLDKVDRALARLFEFGSSANFVKSQWCVPVFELMGHVIDMYGLRVAPSKVEPSLSCPRRPTWSNHELSWA